MKLNDRPYVMITIPVYGEIPLTLQLLNSIVNKSYVSGLSYSISFWDDGSSEDEINHLSNQTNSLPALIVRNDKRVEYTKTVYKCLDQIKQIAEFDFILLVNNDVIFNPATMFSLVKRAVSNTSVAAVGCKVLKRGTTEIQHTGVRLEDGKIVDPYCGLDVNDPRTNQVERRLWVNGCCVLYNLHILRKHGMNFNLEFSPAYFEEADLMTRLNLMGYSIMYEPRAVVEHLVNGTHGKERERYEKVFWANWDKYKDKWSPYFNSKKLQF